VKKSAQQVRFGRILQDLRVRRDITGRELSRRSGIYQSYISKYESGISYPSQEHIKAIADALKLSAVERNRLNSWKRLCDHDFSPFLSSTQLGEAQNVAKGIEDGTDYVRVFQLNLVPGLLQTPDYIDAIFATEAFSTRPAKASDIRKAITGRLERQQILKNKDKRFSFLVRESAIANRIASPAVMKQQVSALLTLVRRGEVDFALIPETQQWKGEIPHTSFYIYDEELVAVEVYGGDLYLYLEDTVKSYVHLFERMQLNSVRGVSCEEELERILRKVSE
jgi:transcriptional regulator with XRE-family HTH domain